MKKSVVILFAVVAIFSMAQVAGAYDGTVKLVGGSGFGPYEVSPGGEFTFQVLTGNFSSYVNSYASTTHNVLGAGVDIPNFQTFCLEKNEYINANGTYNANVTGAAIAGGLGGATGGSDTISVGTAYLYQRFADGTLALAGYDYGAGRLTSAAQLQDTIWYLEDEITAKPSNAFMSLVDSTFTNPKADNPLGGDGVYALNLYDGSSPAQDQLIWNRSGSTVPEPGSMLLLGFGLLGLFGVARRRVK